MKVIVSENQRLKLFLNVLVLAGSLFIVSKEKMAVKESSAFENLMINSFASVQEGVTFMQRRVVSVFKHYFDNISASKENEQLKKKTLLLENKIFTYEELGRENERLRNLLRFGEGITWKKVLAQIVAWDASSDFRVLRINKGFTDGVKLQSTVVTDQGLVGYIYRLTNHFADILTILDPNNRIDGIVQRTRTHGIVEGFSSDRCLMKYVTRTGAIILNDIVLTSGLGNIYPKGLRIGRVSRIDRVGHEVTQMIEILPSVDFSRLEEVVVLVSEEDQVKKEEWEALDSSSMQN